MSERASGFLKEKLSPKDYEHWQRLNVRASNRFGRPQLIVFVFFGTLALVVLLMGFRESQAVKQSEKNAQDAELNAKNAELDAKNAAGTLHRTQDLAANAELAAKSAAESNEQAKA